jgi:hypothetical protein
VVADFIADHMVGLNNDACMVEVIPWKLFSMSQGVVRVGASGVSWFRLKVCNMSYLLG